MNGTINIIASDASEKGRRSKWFGIKYIPTYGWIKVDAKNIGTKEIKTILVMQFTKGVKKAKSTFLITLKEENATAFEEFPKDIACVFEEYKDIVPLKLPKKLTLGREVDNKAELSSVENSKR
ncbi:hypothetical protein K2173_001107 [Erythroxylum novogranatense]|uniref:LAGLIDADG homing endonuclease n=1 Tax=Erythroxylum novogranatense TaxID=1862640 RepID=A0AAV8SIP2_9ROSI|nr:hypothetical protein K2173_001107 [Erythroxylum novogranatense]